MRRFVILRFCRTPLVPLMPMLTPDAFLWKALEFYGTKIHHRGKWRIHEQLRRLLRIRYSGDLKVCRQGLQWILDPGDFVQSSFYWTGEFESWDWYHLTRLVRPGSFVVDVGANFGFYSLMLAHVQQTRVLSFEPCAPTLARLRTNIAMNHLDSMVTPVPLALSDVQQTGFLSSVAGNSGGNFISGRGTPVAMDTLDHFRSIAEIPSIDFIKIDVEGHEPHVLEGAKQTLEADRPGIMIEWNVTALSQSGASAKEVAERLRSLGYQLFIPVRKRLVPFTEDRGIPGIFNVFALHSAALATAGPPNLDGGVRSPRTESRL